MDGNIIFNNINIKYGNIIIHKNLNIKILNNKINCIFGKSGSGKTTIIKTLIKLIKPITGSITINNTNLEDIDTIYLRNNISFMTQEQILFNDTVFKNIIYGCN